MKYKVKIKKLPTAQTGQQVNYGMYNPLATMGGKDGAKPQQTSVRKTIGAVPREEANLEAEGGETVLGDLTGMSIPQHYTITGPRHAQGGVPMSLPDNSFIFSDFNQMKINDPDMLAKFGKAVKKQGKGKGFTPADLAKQYDINKYIKILQDPNSDAVDRKTAELMIKNYNLKLGALAIAQEAKKGFEQGIPAVAEPYLAHLGVSPEELGVSQNPEQMSQEEMACGGTVRKLKRQQGGIPPEAMQQQDPMMNQQQAQDPMQQVMEIAQQMLSQGADGTQVAMELINQGLSPEDTFSVLSNLGMPQEEAQAAIQQVLSSDNPETAPQPEIPMARMGMELGGYDIPFVENTIFQPGGEKKAKPPYSMEEAYTPKGVKLLNEYRKAQGLDAIPENSSKEKIKKAAGELQSKMIKENPDLVMDYMLNVSHQPNKKLLGKIPAGYEKSNAGVRKAIEDGKLTSQDVRDAYKDDQWWYRALGTDAVKLTPEEYKEKQKLIEASGVSQGEYKYLYDPEQNKYIRYYTDEKGNPVAPATVTPEEKKPNEPGKRPDITDIPEGVREGIMPAEWTTPDLLNYYGALADRYSIKKYYPWAARFSPEVPEPVFMDPTRELAAQSEQANILTQGMGQFAGPQALSARASSIQGQGAKQAADTLSRYNQSNVGIANQFAGMAAQIRNQAQQYNLNQAKQLYDQGVITNQQYDNAVRQAKANVRQGFAQGWKNASDIGMLNATSPQYNIDPRTGTVYFTEGKNLTTDKAQTYEDLLMRFKKMGMTDENAIKAAKNAMGASDFAQQGGMVLGSHVFPFMFY